MKKLHLIRHAKSSWNSGDLSDIERPLNARGHKACELMAGIIHDAGCTFENTFASPALRARTTIENIAHHLTDQDIKWEIDEDLYTFSALDLMLWCRRIDEGLSDVVIVGHNPAITEFTNRMTGSDILNVPTCGYIQMEFLSTWKDLDFGIATLNEFITPKMVKGE
ncbi:SixA phosphatase family protein [Pseudemcibacter aquimaris]|uniref:SixA phosphatase family protein n=1 Tax=Pseudemcibacter aquimaris TaxID=2857064 RepID=UPI002011D5A1|nr:histidine phosphatase family protein [Pseudemcibacter aquimaris]MCC3859866.1 histidine phosphatase family protein [Pseudemcibacter aquimaris]WDU57198.1 histidine phosphatase family protein [Pseudemcibacter aquimaris]